MIQARLRTVATLAVLVVVMLAGVAWAFSAVTKPFPERDKVATCTNHLVAKGDKVYPDQVTVSVLNAGDREGLADRTMTDLVGSGLDRGEVNNAPEGTEVTGVQVWAEDTNNPAVKLVISFLGKDAKVVRRDSPLPGVNVVVGEDFQGAVKGRKLIVAREDSTICSPPEDEVEDLDDL
jgi:hypothetical protein